MQKSFRSGYLFLLLFLVALPAAVRAQEEPAIAKDSIHIELIGSAERRGFSIPGWRPHFEYRVNGPIASGSQLYVEVSLPTNKAWVRFDCETGETQAGRSWRTKCGGDTIPGEKATVYAGSVGFAIRMRNEVFGSDKTLFTGKFKVGELPRVKGADPEFYVDEDWEVPIAYVFTAKDEGHGDDEFLHVLFWYRGNPPEYSCHLLYQGKEVAKASNAGNTGADWHPANAQWGPADCSFLGVYPNEAPEDGYDPKFSLKANPGEYEVRAVVAGHLARSIKFTVAADGSFDNGIASANKLGDNRVIVPAQVIGNQGPWNQQAWKTEAFWGNPLTGFTAAAPAAGLAK